MVDTGEQVSGPSTKVDQRGLWGLRGLAAITILFSHSAVVVNDYDPPEFIAQLAIAAVALVHVFLVQSAYLLGRGFLRRQRGGEEVAPARNFVWQRATRILPGYWLMLAVAIPVVHLATWTNPLDGLSALFLLNVYSVPALLASPVQVWCLQVEAGFYLLLPIHDRISRRLVGKGRFPESPVMQLLVLYAIAGVLFLAMVYVGDWKVGYTWPFAYLTTFALGLGLAVIDVCRPPGVPGNRRPRLNTTWSLLIAFLILALVVSSRLQVEAVNITEPSPLWQSLIRRCANDLAAFFMVAPFIFPDGRRSVLREILSSRVAVWLGIRSFHVYLWNIPVIFEVDRLLRGDQHHLPWIVLLAVSLPTCLLVAEIGHRISEPLSMWLRSIGPGSRPRTPKVVPA